MFGLNQHLIGNCHTSLLVILFLIISTNTGQYHTNVGVNQKGHQYVIGWGSYIVGFVHTQRL